MKDDERQEPGILASGQSRVLLLSPITPAATGNGLAMRAAALMQAMPGCQLFTLPLAESDPSHSSLSLEPDALARSWLADTRGRELLARVPTLPRRARLGAPAWGEHVLGSLGTEAFDLVYVLRAYSAGCALPLMRAWPEARFILDVDEDDAAVAAEIAELARDDAARSAWLEQAGLEQGFLSAVAPWFDRVIASSRVEATRLEGKLGRPVNHVVNIAPPAAPPARSERESSLLFVGNLNYPPNRDALERLLGSLLPALRKEQSELKLHVVGRGAEDLRQRWSKEPWLDWHGFVDDLTGLYAKAGLALVPLRAGGGSRIKLLEAMARGTPVVASSKAAEGLEISHGRELLIADSDNELVAATQRLLDQPGEAEALARRALEFVQAHHTGSTVYEQIQTL